LAAAAIEALRSGDFSAGRLGAPLESLAQERQPLGRLIEGFSSEGFCPFEFLAQHPRHQGPLADLLAGRAIGPAAGGDFGSAAGIGLLLDDLDDWLIRHHADPDPQQTLR